MKRSILILVMGLAVMALVLAAQVHEASAVAGESIQKSLVC